MFVLDLETVPNDYALDNWRAVTEMATAREMDPVKFASVSPVLCRVVCAAWCDGLDARPEAPHLTEERALLRALFAAISAAPHRKLCTFNGRGFDLPVLAIRARANGLALPRTVTAALAQKPWETGAHVDLMHELSFGRATSTPSLRACAIGLGLGDPKASCDGGVVLNLWRAGNLEQIANYCKGDVEITAKLARWWMGRE